MMNAQHDSKNKIYRTKTISKRQQVLEILSDGHFHSGEEIGEAIGLTRAAVWKHIKSLQDEGLEIYSVSGRGYCLENAMELIDVAEIKQHLSLASSNALSQLDVLFVVDSTNTYLLNRLAKHPIHGHVVVSEYQTAGRGRRESNWVSPRGAGIYLSVGWRFDQLLADMHCLSLSVGVAIVRALNNMDIQDVGLKWPNDIYHGLKKLGGVLVETRMENSAYADVVVGVGINISLPNKIKHNIDQPVCDIASITNALPSRNKIAASLIEQILQTLSDFQTHGFKRDIETWRKLDIAKEKKVILQLEDQNNIGRVLGIEDNGMLKLSVNGVVKKFMSGQIRFKIDP